MKKFSIPFNGSEPDLYLNSIEQYKEHVEHIFTGVNFISKNHLSQLEREDQHIYDENVKVFLRKALGKYKRVITLNSTYYNIRCAELLKLLESSIFPFLETEKIDGCICTDFIMAKLIHQTFPDIEIHTSCNCFQWNIRQMELWRDECGATVFNPPREILRTPLKLKEMHDAGFKIKAIVNESCLFGCPQQMNHCMAMALGNDMFGMCNRGDLTNFFKGNWVLPRWLNKLDEYVDIYKLSGRMLPLEYLMVTLDAYVNRKEVDNLPLILNGDNSRAMLLAGIKVPSSMVHDKLLICECKECDKTCFACRTLMAKLLMNNNIQ